MLAKDLKKRPLRKGNGQKPPEQPSHQEHARRGRPRQKFRTSVCLLKVFLVMQLYSSEFRCRINKMMYPGREVLALIRPLIARPRAEWNHEDVLALARRLHCYGSVDGTGSAEDIEGAISMSWFIINILLGIFVSWYIDVDKSLQVPGQRRALLKIWQYMQLNMTMYSNS